MKYKFITLRKYQFQIIVQIKYQFHIIISINAHFNQNLFQTIPLNKY